MENPILYPAERGWLMAGPAGLLPAQYRGQDMLASLSLALVLGTLAAHARAQSPPSFDPAPVTVETLRLAGPDNPALERDIEKLRIAANSGIQGGGRNVQAGNSAWILGLLSLHGLGVPKDPVQANIWFERAHSLGEPLAAAGLAWCEIEGCSASANPVAARRWIALLRPVIPARAQYLEWLIEFRMAPLQIAGRTTLKENPLATLPNRELLVRSANAGDTQARVELGLDSVAAGRLTEALGHFNAVAAKSSAATSNAEFLRQRLQSQTQTPAQQFSPPANAADAGDKLAAARRYHHGEGVPANFSEAIRLYRLAAADGNDEARRMLTLIYSRLTPDGQIDIAWMQQLGRLNMTGNTPRPDVVIAPMSLHRDPTPLYDLIPLPWRQQTEKPAR